VRNNVQLAAREENQDTGPPEIRGAQRVGDSLSVRGALVGKKKNGLLQKGTKREGLSIMKYGARFRAWQTKEKTKSTGKKKKQQRRGGKRKKNREVVPSTDKANTEMTFRASFLLKKEGFNKAARPAPGGGPIKRFRNSWGKKQGGGRVFTADPTTGVPAGLLTTTFTFDLTIGKRGETAENPKDPERNSPGHFHTTCPGRKKGRSKVAVGNLTKE